MRWTGCLMIAMAGLALAIRPAMAEDCAAHLDRLQQALDQGEVEETQLATMRQELDQARQQAGDGDDEGCSAAAARLQSAMLQIEGIDSSMLCDRTQSEDEIGEADMSGNQDVQSALQSGCDLAE